MAGKREAVERPPRLVDLGTRAVYRLAYRKQLIAWSGYLDALGDPNVRDTSVAVPGLRCAFYVEVRDDGGREATVQVRSGSVVVRGGGGEGGGGGGGGGGGETIGIGMERKNVPSGSLLQVGDITLQFQISNLNGGLGSLKAKRLLPRTPRQLYQPPEELFPASNDVTELVHTSGEQDDSHVDEALRAELKRISKEIYGRKIAEHRPPPPYEQVANSIGYQLLLHSRKSISAAFIQSFYAVLKKIEHLEPSVVDMYKNYVKLYEEARETGATPQCMHPADVPTVKFLVQLIFHMCSHPALSAVAAESGPKWMQLLSIFSESQQNHAPLVQCKAWGYLLSTMKLTLMATIEPFQRYGWITLSHLIHALPVDDKPIISDQILILALDIASIQLDKMEDNAPLATALVTFLSILAAKATRAAMSSGHKGRIFTAEQGAHVLQTLHTYEVLRRLMELPEELHRDRDYNRAYHSLIRAMAPIARDNNNNKNSAKKTSGGPSSLSGPRTATTPIVVQLVKVRLNTSVPSLLNSSVPSLLTTSTSASMHRMVTSLGSVEKQSMRPSASMFSISSQAERKRRKLPLIPNTHRSHSLKVRTERRARSLGQDEVKEMMGMGTPEVIPPKPPRSAARQKALSAADSQQFIPKSMSVFNILFVASQDEPVMKSGEGEEEQLLLGQSLDSQSFQALKGMTSSLQNVQGGGRNVALQKGGGGGMPKEEPQSPKGPDRTPSDHTLSQITPPQEPSQPLVLKASDTQTGVGAEPPTDTREVTSAPSQQPAPGTAMPLLPAPQVLRPATWRASVDDPLNAEVSKLLSELTVCPEVHASTSLTSSLNSNPPNPSVEPMGSEPAPVGVAQPTDLPPAVVVGSGDSPVVLRHKKGGARVDPPNSDHVTVPRTSLNYFRQSVKRKKGGAVNQGGPAHDLHHASSLPEEADQPPSSGEFPWRANRRSWSQSSLFTGLPGGSLQDEGSQLFELSGVHLSSESAALEGILAEHGDVIETLEWRQEVLDSIQGLWYGDKGLQAATNAVMACFSEDHDVSLFTNILQMFSAFTPPWSLSVCLVVLPTLQQLLQSLREPYHLDVVCNVTLWIVEHFSELILTYRLPQRSQRLQALEDRDKKVMCYRQLHQMCDAIGKRLESRSDSSENTYSLTNLQSRLQPFSEQELVTSPPPC